MAGLVPAIHADACRRGYHSRSTDAATINKPALRRMAWMPGTSPGMTTVSSIPPILDIAGVTKRFPGVLALDRIHVGFRAGEVHAVIGENGAGKSTLMHILAGDLQPSEGEILVDGKADAFRLAARQPRRGHRRRLSGTRALPDDDHRREHRHVGHGRAAPSPR